MTVGGPEALGKILRFASPHDDGAAVNPGIKRFALRQVAGELLPDERVNWCYKRLIPIAKTAELWRNPEKQTGHWHNLASCGSVWHCPVCAARITESRRVELQEAIDRAAGRAWGMALLTLTVQHDRDNTLRESLEAVAGAWRKTTSGKGWQTIKSKYGLLHTVAGLEITCSKSNGWHPHKHVIMFFDRELLPEELETLADQVSFRYRAALAGWGRWASAEVGIDLRAGNTGVGDYVAKWGMAAELAKAPVKTGRHQSFSPFELLALAGQGDKWAAGLFVEYGRTMKGRKQLFWSRGLRDALALGGEKADQDLAGDDLADLADGQQVLFASLTRQQFSRLNQIEKERKGIKGELKLLAGAGDVEAFWRFLAGMGIFPTGLNQTIIGVYDGLDPRNFPPGETVKNGDSIYNPPEGAWEGVETVLASKRCQTSLAKTRAFSDAAGRLSAELSQEHDWDALATRLANKINPG